MENILKIKWDFKTKESQYMKWEKQLLDELRRKLETAELENRSIEIIQSEKQREK